MTGQRCHHVLTISSSLAAVAEVVQVVINEALTLQYTDHAVFAIRLALEEALVNAIRHGNGSDPQKKVQIDYAVTSRQVTITVCDEGPGFHPEHVPDPTLDENLRKPYGRGVLLMKAYMDKVTFNKQGNCVTMVRRRRNTTFPPIHPCQ